MLLGLNVLLVLSRDNCLYLRVVEKNRKVHLQLLCAKSKVAPLKSLTIPRLELCASQLLASLARVIISEMKINFDKIYYWTGSTIVLHWLNTPPCQLKVFASNRVANIQETSDVKNWHHVSSKDNPADLISRGMSADDFLSSSLWKFSPAWLYEPSENWPSGQGVFPPDKLPELRQPIC